MKKLLLSLLLLAGIADPQTATYPSAVPADVDLLVATNRAETTLGFDINNSTLSITVASASAFSPNTLVTIDNEIIKVCAASGITLTVCAGGRGYDGSAAAAHSQGVKVRAQVTAYYHNKLAKEIIAIADSLKNHLVINPTGLTDGTYHGPLLIWHNPSTVNAGEVGGIYINLSNNIGGTPGAGDLVGQTTRVTNDTLTNSSLWSHDFIVQQGSTPTSPNVQIRGIEVEVQSAATALTWQSDPFLGTGHRANGVEIVGIGTGASANRLTSALTVWSNNSALNQWWDKGISLSRVGNIGLYGTRISGDSIEPFQTAFVYDHSNSATVLLVDGSHTNLIDASGVSALTSLIKVGLASPTNFVEGSGGPLVKFSDVRMQVFGPAGNGSGNEALAVNANGVTWGVRRIASGAGTLEAGAISNHNLAIVANGSTSLYIDATNGWHSWKAPTTAPVPQAAGFCAPYLDEGGNAAKLICKYSDGTTVKTGTINLL